MAVTEEKAQHEPTMEEILASIRRIISANGSDGAEDEAAANGVGAEAAPAPEAEAAEHLDVPPADPETEEDVLELTERIDPEPDPEPEAADEAETLEAPAGAAPESESERLVSPAAAMASVSSLGELAGLLASAGKQDDFRGRSVEELVAELLRPMLRAWLDQNLPGMVETLVRAEIERLADQVKR